MVGWANWCGSVNVSGGVGILWCPRRRVDGGVPIVHRLMADGEMHLVGDLEVICGKTPEHVGALVIGHIMRVLYPVGVPLGTYYFLRRAQLHGILYVRKKAEGGETVAVQGQTEQDASEPLRGLLACARRGKRGRVVLGSDGEEERGGIDAVRRTRWQERDS